MIFESARLAARNLLAPETRAVFWKTLGMTIALMIGAWFLLEGSFTSFVMPWLQSFAPDLPAWLGWLGFVVGLIAGIGLAIALALLVAPVTAIVAGLFLDDVAEVIERRDYPGHPVGKALPMSTAIIQTIKFFGIVVLGNLIALALLFVPGINIAAFFLVNGYLLGREFFEFAAMRYRSPEEAKILRAKHSTTVFLAGLVIAAFLSVPLLNLATPLFAAGLMVHLHQRIVHEDPEFALAATA